MAGASKKAMKVTTIAIGAAIALVALSACQRIGGAGNTFGNDPTRAGAQPQLWASINGPYTNHQDGDPYSTKCVVAPATATACDASGANPAYTSVGYVWAIDVSPAAIGVPVTVEVYDPELMANTGTLDSIVNGGFATSYRLFGSTGTGTYDLSPSNGMDTLGRCVGPGTGSKVFAAGSTESAAAWYSLCTFTPNVAGAYPLQVRSSGIPGVPDSGGGFNNFAIRATTSGPPPRVAALDRASVMFATPGSTSRSYLANIDQTKAGHTLAVDLFDPGDGTAGSSPIQIQVLAPPSGIPSIVPTGGSAVACNYNANGSASIGPATPEFSATCTVTTEQPNSSSAIYNNKWLRLSITIPTSYTCAIDCWWTLVDSIGTGSTPTDRLVYEVSVN